MNYIIQKGDWLSKIALKYYGDMDLWRDLAAHNQLANPNMIRPGQLIDLPPTLRGVALKTTADPVTGLPTPQAGQGGPINDPTAGGQFQAPGLAKSLLLGLGLMAAWLFAKR